MRLEIARQLASHPKFQWVAGMRVAGGPDLPPLRIVLVGSHRDPSEPGREVADILAAHEDGYGVTTTRWCDVPDLADAATAGVLLAWLAAAPTGDVSARREEGIWCAGDGWRLHEVAPTLGEAAARALLATWGPE